MTDPVAGHSRFASSESICSATGNRPSSASRRDAGSPGGGAPLPVAGKDASQDVMASGVLPGDGQGSAGAADNET